MIEIYRYLSRGPTWNEKKARLVNNGCGTAGWKGKLVPDTIYAVNIKAACLIHDYNYFIGKTLSDKYSADIRFYYNLLDIIEHQTTWKSRFLNPLRRRRALTYYQAVEFAGKQAFLKGKEGVNNG